MTLDNDLDMLSMIEDEDNDKTNSKTDSSVDDPDFEETMKFAERIRNYDTTQKVSTNESTDFSNENIMDYIGGSTETTPEESILQQLKIDPKIDVNDAELANLVSSKRADYFNKDDIKLDKAEFDVNDLGKSRTIAKPVEDKSTERAETNKKIQDETQEMKKRLKQIETLMELLLNKVSEYPKVYKEYENVVRKNAKMIRDIKG